jgi:acetyl-CoA carboxylase biotin carboxyl carrier protein
VGRELEAVRRIIDAFERSDWNAIDVRFGDVRVVLSTDPSSPPEDRATPRPGDRGRDGPADDVGGDEPPVDVAEGDQPEADGTTDPDVVHVVSPSPGLFWRSPEPGAPPFVDVGAVVEPTSTVCIVEIMKLMNHVKAGVAGRIIRVLAGNGEPVEKGDPIFVIAPVQPGTQS